MILSFLGSVADLFVVAFVSVVTTGVGVYLGMKKLLNEEIKEEVVAEKQLRLLNKLLMEERE